MVDIRVNAGDVRVYRTSTIDGKIVDWSERHRSGLGMVIQFGDDKPQIISQTAVGDFSTNEAINFITKDGRTVSFSANDLPPDINLYGTMENSGKEATRHLDIIQKLATNVQADKSTTIDAVVTELEEDRAARKQAALKPHVQKPGLPEGTTQDDLNELNSAARLKKEAQKRGLTEGTTRDDINKLDRAEPLKNPAADDKNSGAPLMYNKSIFKGLFSGVQSASAGEKAEIQTKEPFTSGPNHRNKDGSIVIGPNDAGPVVDQWHDIANAAAKELKLTSKVTLNPFAVEPSSQTEQLQDALVVKGALDKKSADNLVGPDTLKAVAKVLHYDKDLPKDTMEAIKALHRVLPKEVGEGARGGGK